MKELEELRKARISKNLSQLDLSSYSGVGQSNISRIERGLDSPTLTTLKKLADAMDMKLVIEFREKQMEDLKLWFNQVIGEKAMVILEGDGYSDGNIVYDTAICPYCGYVLDDDYDPDEHHEPYCPHCARRLDWGETK